MMEWWNGELVKWWNNGILGSIYSDRRIPGSDKINALLKTADIE
jgi:hypothetical protein